MLLDLCQGKQLGYGNSIKCATPHCTNLIFVIDHITNCVVGVQNSVIFTCFQHLHLDKVFGMLRAEKKFIKFSVKFIAGLIWIQKCIIRYCILNKKILSPHLITHQNTKTVNVTVTSALRGKILSFWAFYFRSAAKHRSAPQDTQTTV